MDVGADSGGEARRALIAGDGRLPAAVRADVLLLLPELVTNAIRHSGTRFTRVTPSVRADQSGGFGLVLVDGIANSWGVGRSESGTRVWFEIEFER